MSSLKAIDDASEAVRRGFRVTLADLKAQVADERVIEHETLTVVILTMRNGWFLVGKSAPVDTSNYNAELGVEMARDDALRQAWPLLAYAWLDARPTCSCQNPDAVHQAGDEAYHPDGE